MDKDLAPKVQSACCLNGLKLMFGRIEVVCCMCGRPGLGRVQSLTHIEKAAEKCWKTTHGSKFLEREEE